MKPLTNTDFARMWDNLRRDTEGKSWRFERAIEAEVTKRVAQRCYQIAEIGFNGSDPQYTRDTIAEEFDL